MRTDKESLMTHLLIGFKSSEISLFLFSFI